MTSLRTSMFVLALNVKIYGWTPGARMSLDGIIAGCAKFRTGDSS